MASDCGDVADEVFAEGESYIGDFRSGTTRYGTPRGWTKCGWECEFNPSDLYTHAYAAGGESGSGSSWTPYETCGYSDDGFCTTPSGPFLMSTGCYELTVVEDSTGPRGLEHYPAMRIGFNGDNLSGATWVGGPHSDQAFNQTIIGSSGVYRCDTSGNGLFYWSGPMPSCEDNPGGTVLGTTTRQDGTYTFVGVGGARNGESWECGPSPDYVDPNCNRNTSMPRLSAGGPGWHLEPHIFWRFDCWVKADLDYLGRSSVGQTFGIRWGAYPFIGNSGGVVLDGDWQFVRIDFANPLDHTIIEDATIVLKLIGATQNRISIDDAYWIPDGPTPYVVTAPRYSVIVKCVHLYPRDQPVKGGLPLNPVKFRAWDVSGEDLDPQDELAESTHEIDEVIA